MRSYQNKRQGLHFPPRCLLLLFSEPVPLLKSTPPRFLFPRIDGPWPLSMRPFKISMGPTPYIIADSMWYPLPCPFRKIVLALSVPGPLEFTTTVFFVSPSRSGISESGVVKFPTEDSPPPRCRGFGCLRRNLFAFLVKIEVSPPAFLEPRCSFPGSVLPP